MFYLLKKKNQLIPAYYQTRGQVFFCVSPCCILCVLILNFCNGFLLDEGNRRRRKLIYNYKQKFFNTLFCESSVRIGREIFKTSPMMLCVVVPAEEVGDFTRLLSCLKITNRWLNEFSVSIEQITKMHRFKASKYRNAAPKIPKREVGINVVDDLPSTMLSFINRAYFVHLFIWPKFSYLL